MNKDEMIDKIADYVVDYPRFEESATEVAGLIYDLVKDENEYICKKCGIRQDSNTDKENKDKELDW